MPNPKTEEVRARRYLASALKLNPVLDGERIVALRSRFLRLESPDAAAGKKRPPDIGELRQRMSSRLDDIRRSFWKSDVGLIRKKLSQLKLDRFPDLRLARERLMILAEHRHEFGQFAEKGVADPGFFKSLRVVLVAPPGVAAASRDELIESIRNPARLKQVRSMIRRIRKQMPEIYALESDWLDSIARMQKRKVKKQSQNSGFFNIDLDGLGWVIWILVFVILRIVIRIGGSSD